VPACSRAHTRSRCKAGAGFLTEKGGLQLVWRRRVSGGYDQFFEAGLTIYLE
jgi:hypothetical protein